MNKKGVEISMNLIIIAIMGLLVLVITAAILTGKVSWFSKNAADCMTQSGRCAVQCGSEDYNTQNMIVNPSIECPPDNTDEPQVCCLPIALK